MDVLHNYFNRYGHFVLITLKLLRYKHWATGIEHCASGFISHSATDFTLRIFPSSSDDLDSDWHTSTKSIGPIPNLITVTANVLEIYTVRLQEDSSSPVDSKNPAEPKRGGVLSDIFEASIELVCHYSHYKKKTLLQRAEYVAKGI
ncbi:Cleavage and polyadenylation specificity factor subunit 1 [Forsythia ovata]|uniref:Cleavage and polyadenylation specificity factor subunit 1 n=1 Tax=Forsythia ovata TaxID=205694 RepID=A0ABD1P6R2_9LAMI